jgi:transposase-like protein
MKKRASNPSAGQPKTARRKYDEEFKQQALTMIRRRQSVRSVAQALGISESLLHHWTGGSHQSVETHFFWPSISARTRLSSFPLRPKYSAI